MILLTACRKILPSRPLQQKGCTLPEAALDQLNEKMEKKTNLIFSFYRVGSGVDTEETGVAVRTPHTDIDAIHDSNTVEQGNVRKLPKYAIMANILRRSPKSFLNSSISYIGSF